MGEDLQPFRYSLNGYRECSDTPGVSFSRSHFPLTNRAEKTAARIMGRSSPGGRSMAEAVRGRSCYKLWEIPADFPGKFVGNTD